MTRIVRTVLIIGACVAALFAAVSQSAVEAQDRRAQDRRAHAPSPPPPPRAPHPARRGEWVFIGGFYYDPFYGPYPWWPRPAYPHHYFPIYDMRATVRLMVTPREAAVYVDGFYAGAVDDFDGVFQGLPLPPGGHSFVFYLEGYRTTGQNLYLRPGSTLKIHDVLVRLPAGVASEPPPVAAAIPMPPTGTYRLPQTPPPAAPSTAPAAPPTTAASFGTFDLRVQPATAIVTIDGAPWVSSDAGHFVIELAAGTHRLEVTNKGFRAFSKDVDVRAGATTPLNVSLPPE